MKIINPDSIHNSEEDFIDTINAELDWEVIEKFLLEKHKFSMQDDVDYKKGDIVVYKDQIAYKYDFDIKVALSIVLGRDGKCLEISTSGDIDPEVESESEFESESESGFEFESDLELKSESESDFSSNSPSDPDSPDSSSPYDKDLQETGTVDKNDVTDLKKTEKNFVSDDSSETEKKDISKMAADIADMNSDINQGDN